MANAFAHLSIVFVFCIMTPNIGRACDDLTRQSDADEFVSCIGSLAAQIASLETTLESVQFQHNNLVQSMGGLVAAFASECPDGWREYEQARGRFVIGAFPGRELLSLGGEAEVTLTIAHMPEHRHLNNVSVTDRFLSEVESAVIGLQRLESVPIPAGHWSEWLSSGEGGDRNYRYTMRFQTGSEQRSVVDSNSGGNQPHNNMPPYIALYWCTPEIPSE